MTDDELQEEVVHRVWLHSEKNELTDDAFEALSRAIAHELEMMADARRRFRKVALPARRV